MCKIRKDKAKIRSMGNTNFQNVVKEGKKTDERNSKNTCILGRRKTSPTICCPPYNTFAGIVGKIN